MDFVSAVIEILVTEHSRTKDEAENLTKRFPKVMVNAMMAGVGNYRAAAIALEMAESRSQDAPFNPDK